ncbi:MAG: hypothetical protein KDM81_04880, partial [Verrucomicrobiae bacterium]|nr:hypothetical protein [Verrucomicrobiae bacterium]
AGADRTGLVAALYCLIVKGEAPAEAARQLALGYGHVPLLRTIAMDHCFWRLAEHRAETARAEGCPPLAAQINRP